MGIIGSIFVHSITGASLQLPTTITDRLNLRDMFWRLTLVVIFLLLVNPTTGQKSTPYVIGCPVYIAPTGEWYYQECYYYNTQNNLNPNPKSPYPDPEPVGKFIADLAKAFRDANYGKTELQVLDERWVREDNMNLLLVEDHISSKKKEL